ncbi:MAG: hydrolase, partial [Deltaproteobacteria bacterium]|nr:hydrolase [Deltaproteobacteria bacterium]
LKVTSDEISHKYNTDVYNPRDGSLIKAIDELSAFTEAYIALNNGVNSSELKDALTAIKEKYKDKVISGVDFGRIYGEFQRP